MNNKRGKDTAASVRDRLLALSRERSEDFQLLLTQYGLERLLYRLSQSSYQNRPDGLYQQIRGGSYRSGSETVSRVMVNTGVGQFW